MNIGPPNRNSEGRAPEAPVRPNTTRRTTELIPSEVIAVCKGEVQVPSNRQLRERAMVPTRNDLDAFGIDDDDADVLMTKGGWNNSYCHSFFFSSLGAKKEDVEQQSLLSILKKK